MKSIIKTGEIPLFTTEDFFKDDENVYIQISTEYPDFVGVTHKHTFIEIVYILSGSAMYYVGKHNYPVAKGDLCIVNYETPHAFIASENHSEPFVAYDLMFTPSFIDTGLAFFSSFESISSSYLFYSLFPEQQPYQPDLQLKGNKFNNIGEVFNKIYHEYHAREQGFIDLIRAYVIELIIKIFRIMNSIPTHEQSSQHKKIVDSVLLYMREHFDNPITNEALAENVFLSKDYFAKLFKQTTGISVKKFLQTIRMDEACIMLKSTDYTVDEIAKRCGYIQHASAAGGSV